MGRQYILSIDQSTQGTKAMLLDEEGRFLLRRDMPHRQIISNQGWVGHDAEEIADVFATGEVDRIYLNFSDPWPKDRHAKRRLTSRQFLARYNEILKKDGQIEFKTDNRVLFDFSVEEVEPAGWHIKELTYDLHNDEKMNEGNIMTEYEERFSGIGTPINKMVIAR